MPTKRTPRPPTPETGYEKVSATLERPLLRMIRERSTNVSEFLNQAAKDKLYFERLREAVQELRREGYEADPVMQERIRKALLGHKGGRSRK